MTLLQRGVVDRLCKAGYSSLADAAWDAWQAGEPCNLPNVVNERDSELRADYERANCQAAPDVAS